MRTRALWLWAPWALFVALALGWVIYWHTVADTAQRRIEDWVDAQNALGGQASIARIVRHGFPVLLRLELREIAFAPARAGWRADTERADVNIALLNPQHVILEAKAPLQVTREGGAVTNVVADALIASLRSSNGALVMAGIEVSNLQLDDPDKEGVLAARRVVVNVRRDPRTAGAYQVAFDAQTLVLPRTVRSFEAFGLDVRALRAAIVLEHGAALLDASPQDPLGPWRETGGRLRFEALVLNWGPLETTGRGEGGLDEQRRLEGQIELPIERPAPVLTAIANGPGVDADAQRALALLAAGYAISGDDITLDVEARDGVLRLEGLPVRPLPPVY